MKKIISLILCVMLVVGAVAVSPVSVSAENWGKLGITVYVTSPETTGTITDVKCVYEDPRGVVHNCTPWYEYQWLNSDYEVVADNQSLPADVIAASGGEIFWLRVSVYSCYYKLDESSDDLVKVNLAQVAHGNYISQICTDHRGKSVHNEIHWSYSSSTRTINFLNKFDPVVFPYDNSVEISIPEPVAGERPSFSPIVPEGVKLVFTECEWYNFEDSVNLTSASPFKKGYTYAFTAYVQLVEIDNHYWPDGPINFTINGKEATATGGSEGKYTVYYKFPPASAKSYNLWLGNTQVTDDNCGNILGNGKASFDPATNTLTLNKATISGSHTGADGNAASIYAEGMDLTVKGSGTIGNDNVGIGICQYNSDLTTNCSLTLDGNFTFKGEYGVFTVGSLTVDGGTITSTGTIMALGDVQVNAGLNKLEVNVSGEYGTFGSFAGQLTLDPSLKITLPAGGKVKDNGIVDANGQFVTHVVIRGESETYIRGDVDGDGEVTILDATAIQRHLASLPTKAYHEEPADADEDKEVTILDATAIQRHLASLPTQAQGIGKPIA